MNWLLIVVGALLVGSVVLGYVKGFLRTAFSLISWIAVLIVCYIVTPIAVDYIMEKTDVVSVLGTYLEAQMQENFGGETYSQIEDLLPDELKEELMEEIIDLGGIVYSILHFTVSIIIVLLARLVVRIIDGVLGIASKLPLIGSVDKLLGALLGVAKGLVWCWIVLAIVTILALTGTNTELLAMVNESEALTWLYENNIIIKMVLKTI